MSLKSGDKFIDFTLKSHNLEDVKLSDYVGKINVLLLFFPLVNTGVCEKELCSTRDSIADYANLNAKVFAISVDSPFAQRLWNEKFNFGFDLLSDFNKEVCANYGAKYDVFIPGKFDYLGVAKRSAFIIDKEGIIRYAEVLENAGDEPNYLAIKETLTNL